MIALEGKRQKEIKLKEQRVSMYFQSQCKKDSMVSYQHNIYIISNNLPECNEREKLT